MKWVRLPVGYLLIVLFWVLPVSFTAASAADKRVAPNPFAYVKNSDSNSAYDLSSQDEAAYLFDQKPLAKAGKIQLDVTAINQNSLRYTSYEKGYAYAAGCVPASFAMLIDYAATQLGLKKIDFDKVMQQLRKKYNSLNELQNVNESEIFALASKIKSYFKPIPTSVNMADKNFKMALQKIDLGNGFEADFRLKAYANLNHLHKFLSVVKENLDKNKPVALQTSAMDQKYAEVQAGNGLNLKSEQDPKGKRFPWIGGHEMVITGYETDVNCTHNTYRICRLFLNDTHSSTSHSYTLRKAFWKKKYIGVALVSEEESEGNHDVYLIMGTNLDLLVISDLKVRSIVNE